MRQLPSPHQHWIGRILTLGVFVIASLVMPGIQKEAVQLHKFAWSAIGNAEVVLDEVATPRSGEEAALRDETLAMLKLLRAEQIETYSCSPEIRDWGLLFQRLVESAWPIRYSKDSPFVVSFLSERSDCREIAVEAIGRRSKLRVRRGDRKVRGVRLAHCP